MNDTTMNDTSLSAGTTLSSALRIAPVRRMDALQTFFWVALIAAGLLLSYSNTLHVPFVFDDHGAILGNPGLKHFGSSLFPSDKFGLAGRPFASLTFALNYAFGKDDVVGYHLLNLLIHLGAAWLMFGVVRRTVQGAEFAEKLKRSATAIGGVVALLWALHPVQTESVTYISQRTESLMGFFYLLAIYAFVRGVSSDRSTKWKVISVGAVIFGAMTKEVIATAPLLILFFDRIFWSESWTSLWRQRKGYYGALMIGWGIILWSTIRVNHGDVGLGHGVGPWTYLMTSAKSVAIYLKLAFYPKPLLIDYGTKLVQSVSEIWRQGLLIVALLIGTLAALWRTPKLGFLGLWFFVILAPVSSFIPVLGQVTADHRLYLSLAAAILLIVFALFASAGRWALLALLPLAVLLGRMTYERNRDYRSEVSLWTDATEKNPTNSRAFLNLGTSLERAREIPAALQNYEKAVALDPQSVDAHYALALRFARNPMRQKEAARELAKVVELDPGRTLAHVEYGNVLFKMPGEAERAAEHYQAALKLEPNSAEISANLANAWTKVPEKFGDALKEYDAAIRLNPKISDIHYMKARALVRVPDRYQEAENEFSQAIQIDPQVAEYHFFYGVYLAQIKKDFVAAEAQYREAVRLNPSYHQAHYNLGLILRRDPKRLSEAVSEFEKVLAIDPSVKQAAEMIAKLKIEQALAPR